MAVNDLSGGPITTILCDLRPKGIDGARGKILDWRTSLNKNSFRATPRRSFGRYSHREPAMAARGRALFGAISSIRASTSRSTSRRRRAVS